MNKAKYLAALRVALSWYQWAADEARLEKYMAVVADSLAGKGPGYEFNGVASCQAWKEIGGKGKPSLKALRALPE